MLISMFRVCLVFLFVISASAHVKWTIPEERAGADLKIDPCGGVSAGELSAEYIAGDTVKLEFEEFINHPGYYEIQFSEGSEDEFKKIASIPDTLDVVEFWEYPYIVPEIECASCILRIRMTMTDKKPPNLYYHSCFDFSITLPEVIVVPPITAVSQPFSNQNGQINWSNVVDLKEVNIYSLQGALKFQMNEAKHKGPSGSIDLKALNLTVGTYILNYTADESFCTFEFQVN